jgi:hypothetical protein
MADKSFHCGKEGEKVQLVARRREETFQCVVVAKQSPPTSLQFTMRKKSCLEKNGGGRIICLTYPSHMQVAQGWPKPQHHATHKAPTD